MTHQKSPSKQGADLAQQFREQHSLGKEPIHDITSLLRLLPADFMVLELPQNLDALALRDPSTNAVIVGIGTSSSPYRQRLTIAHEIGHILSGDISKSSQSFVCEKSAPEETRANTFARCLLCPADALPPFQSSDPLETLSAVVRHFQVSPAVAAYQLEYAGIFTAEQVQDFQKIQAPALASKFGWKSSYDRARAISQLSQSSERLVADAYAAYANGQVSLATVAFAEQVSLEEASASAEGARALQALTTDSNADIFADLDSFFSDGD